MAASRFDDIIDSLKRLQQEIPDSLSLKDIKQDIGNTIRNISSPLLIMVMGEFSTGKSTFINALVGQDVAKVDAKPTTAVITKLVYGANDKITVVFRDGSRKEYDANSFAKLTAEGDKKSNELHEKMDYVERAMPIKILKSMTIIDSPGLNSIKAVHEETTRRFMDNADTVIWLFDAHNPGRQTEIDALKRLNPRLSPLVLVNKIDTIDEDEGDSVEQVITDIERTLRNNKLDAQRIVGVSAKMAMQGKKNNNEKLVEESRIADFYTAIEEVVLPRREEYKRNSLLDGLARIVFRVGNAVEEERAKTADLRDTDYTKYIETESSLAATNDELENIAAAFGNEMEGQRPSIFGVRQKLKLNAAEKAFFGVLYWLGLCVEKDEKTAQQYMEEAAVRNDAMAQMNLAEMYRQLGQEDKAKYWFERLGVKEEKDISSACSAANVSSSSECGYGLDLVNEYDHESLTIISRTRSKKNTHNRILAMPSSQKTEQTANNAESTFIPYIPTYGSQTTSSLSNGNTASTLQESNLTAEEMYRKGKHCDNSGKHAEAIEWYKKAAIEGYAAAMYRIGDIYETSNIEEAMVWYKKAADAGHKLAQAKVNGTTTTSLYQMHKSTPTASYNSGYTSKDNKSFNDMTQAQKKQEGERLFQKGKQCDSSNNYTEALKWYKKAAEMGNADAAYNVGYMYKFGLGITKDYSLALKWFKKASKNGSSEAKLQVKHLQKELSTPSRKSSGSCYITTAVCNTLQKPDDCYELTMLRKFRDGWLKAQPNGEGLIRDYYAIAPAIVANIDARNDAQGTYRAIWKNYLSPCLAMLENGRNEECKSMYTRMVLELKKRFIP